jgi:hypothetical protein
VTEPTGYGHISADNPAALSVEEILRRAKPLPPLEDSVIEDLTEDEARIFWQTIRSA